MDVQSHELRLVSPEFKVDGLENGDLRALLFSAIEASSPPAGEDEGEGGTFFNHSLPDPLPSRERELVASAIVISHE